MSKWQPAGLVSPLPLPEICSPSKVIAVWMPVGDTPTSAPPLDISRVPLVDAFEASTFVTQKRSAEHAAGSADFVELTVRLAAVLHVGVGHAPAGEGGEGHLNRRQRA